MQRQINLKFVLLCIIILFIFFNLYIFLQRNSQPSTSSLNNSSLERKPTSNQYNDSLFQWKTYNNSKYLYSLKYPPNLTIKEDIQKDEVIFGITDEPNLVPILKVNIFSGSQNELKEYVITQDTPDKQISIYNLFTKEQSNNETSILILTLYQQNIKNNNMDIEIISKESKSSLDLTKVTQMSQ